MFLGSLKGQIMALVALTLVGMTALYFSWDDNATPYGAGSAADVIWQECKRDNADDSRGFASCTCPLDQTMREVPEAMCLHMQMVELWRKGEKEADVTQVFEDAQQSCKEAVNKKALKEYKEILKMCNLRYMKR